jgi:hypothetical protein
MSLFRYESNSARQQREYDERHRRITVFFACILIALILVLIHEKSDAGGWSAILNYFR